MSTADNLREAFAGESKANRTYLAFAKKAETDGFPQIAKLFRAAAEAETVHALAHLQVLGGVKTTEENLQAAINGEAFEYREMYPKFLLESNSEQNRQASNSISNALAVEEIHFNLYSEALGKLKNGQDLPSRQVFVCGVCGNTVYGQAPDVCPICGTPKSRFSEIV